MITYFVTSLLGDFPVRNQAYVATEFTHLEAAKAAAFYQHKELFPSFT